MLIHMSLLIIFIVCLANQVWATGSCPSAPRVSVSGQTLLINDQSVPLRAVAYSISYPGVHSAIDVPLSIVEKDFHDIKMAGFNSIRTYEPLPPHLLDLLEKSGLFIIQGVAHIDDSTNFDSEEELQEIIDRAVAIVKRDRCRHSILFWSLWNDAPFNWGSSGGNIVSRYGTKTIHKFLTRLYDAVKDADPNHPITASNVLNARFFEIGMDVIDIIGVNAYIGIYDWVTQSFSNELGANLVDRIKNLSDKFGKPIWISEMGYASIPSKNTQAIVIPQQIGMASQRVLGYSIFQWHDDWSKGGSFLREPSNIEAHWGLVDAFRKPKPSFSAIVAAIKGYQIISEPLKENLSHIEASAVYRITNPESLMLDDFSYSTNQHLRSAYSRQSIGNAHFRISLQSANDSSKKYMNIRFVPEEYGSWLLISRSLLTPFNINGFRSVKITIRSDGHAMNFSLNLYSPDGRVFRSPPLPLSIPVTTTYSIPLKDFVLDLLSGPQSLDPEQQPLKKIEGFGFRLNDVANFESPGTPANFYIENVALEK